MTTLSTEQATALVDASQGTKTHFCDYLSELFVERDHVPEFPVRVLWEVCEHCHLDCRHCWADLDADVTPPSRDRKLAVADEIAREGAEVVSFSGGEPLLAADLRPLVRRLSESDTRIELLTNGELVPDNEWLCDLLSPTDAVQVSLDGPPDVHERQRVGSRFEKLTEGIRLLQSAGVPVRANVTVTPINVDAIAETIETAARLDLEPLSVTSVYPIGDGVELWERFDREAYLERLGEALVETDHEIHLYPPIDLFEVLDSAPVSVPRRDRDDPGSLRLPDGRTKLQIQADGTIYPGNELAFEEFACGNIADRSLTDAWHDDTWDDLRAGRDLTGTKCCDCAYLPLCRGGNPVRTREFYGSMDHADPLCDRVPAD